MTGLQDSRKAEPGMTAEEIIAQVVREWTGTVMPGDRSTADAAVVYALESFAGGASVTEACEEARKMVMCRSRHPSYMAVAGRGRLAVAS